MAKILIADDSGIMRITLRTMLEKLSHEVVSEAKNGRDAVELYKQHRPDLITMDVSMPSDDLEITDGIVAIKHIKQINPKARIIIISSHGDQDRVLKAIQLGASSYILKPLNKDRLQHTIDKTLKKP